MRPKLLDLFCGAGGAAVGYHRAGLDVVGVDNKPQKNYPFEFVRGDALDLLARWGKDFAAIHASPPCQDYSSSAGPHEPHGTAWILPATLRLLRSSGRPWVVENVPGAEAVVGRHVVLCGSAFGLKVRRHRLFAASFGLASARCNHREQGPVVTVVGHGAPSKSRRAGELAPTAADCRAAMGIDWMTRDELSQAIPPAYTEYIGKQLIAVL